MIMDWKPIESAPKGVEANGKKATCWMLLAWPDNEGGYHTASGMRVDDKFFAAATFYTGGSFDGKQYTLKEIEVFPTHWMEKLEPPVAAAEQKAVKFQIAEVLYNGDFDPIDGEFTESERDSFIQQNSKYRWVYKAINPLNPHPR